MARLEDRLPGNAPGDYFVDSSCIDCDTCRFVAPAVFTRSPAHDQSIVHLQPRTPEDRRRAAMALVACPTSSIGVAPTAKSDIAAVKDAFPDPLTPDVLYCGYASESSYGASAYLLLRPTGNVLIDSPRATKPLLKRLRELGGARYMFLTHRDDVADHAIFARELGCQRILHEADLSSGTREVEILLRGSSPVELAPDLLALPVPGHTRGSTVLLCHGASPYLFTGDHLAGDDDATPATHLEAWRSVCWYSWPQQTTSMESLLAHDFTWVLPGHGRVLRTDSAAAMREKLTELLGRMRKD